jgi:hypothetical protein
MQTHPKILKLGHQYMTWRWGRAAGLNSTVQPMTLSKHINPTGFFFFLIHMCIQGLGHFPTGFQSQSLSVDKPDVGEVSYELFWTL